MLKTLIASAALALTLSAAGPALADSGHHSGRHNYERQGYSRHWQPPRQAWNDHDRHRHHWRHRHHRPGWAYNNPPPPRPYYYAPRPSW